MKILGIDPGDKESAYILWDSGKIAESCKLRNEDLLDTILDGFGDVDICVIEMIQSFGMSVGKEVVDTCVWIGRYAQAWDFLHSNNAQFIYRRDIKLALCGNVRAKDANIRQALINWFGAQGTKKAPGPTYGLSGDMWSAFAVVATFLDSKAYHKIEERLK